MAVQLKDEFFLEDINNVLNTGEVRPCNRRSPNGYYTLSEPVWAKALNNLT